MHRATTFHLQGNYKTRKVMLCEKELTPDHSLTLRNRSPDGFAWGYGGSGPSQLALAICAQMFDDEMGVKIYQDFKHRVISQLPQTDFDAIINIAIEKDTILSTSFVLKP